MILLVLADKTPAEIKELFGVEGDFTDEEVQAVRLLCDPLRWCVCMCVRVCVCVCVSVSDPPQLFAAHLNLPCSHECTPLPSLRPRVQTLAMFPWLDARREDAPPIE